MLASRRAKKFRSESKAASVVLPEDRSWPLASEEDSSSTEQKASTEGVISPHLPAMSRLHLVPSVAMKAIISSVRRKS